MRRLSVRWRVTAIATGLFALALGLASVVLVRTVRNNLVDGIRSADQEQLAELASQVEDGLPGQLNLPQAPRRGFPVYKLVTPAGEFLILSDGSVRPYSPRGQIPRSHEDLHTRQVVDSPDGEITLTAQRSLAEVDDTVNSITDALWIGFPALVLLVGLLTWYFAGRALRPVEAIRAEAAAITGSTIHRRVPVPETDDEVAALAVTMNQMLDRLEDASSRQRRFVSDASHELRSPVASIRTQLEVALRRPDRSDWPGVAQRVLAEDERLEQAVADLVDLARLDEDEGGGGFAEVDLDDIVLEECARERSLPIDTSHVSGGRVLGRRDTLARVVRNLIDNACRHAESHVWVSVGIAEDDIVELIVADDGPGIAVDDRERVFERFTRLDEGRARDAGGMGLGLAVVKATVERHHGTVTISDNVPHGARFVIRMPAA